MKAKANTLAVPVDNGEYLYYHKSTGHFAPLQWNDEPKPDIVLSSIDMAFARKAFQLTYPGKRYALAHYDLETDTFAK